MAFSLFTDVPTQSSKDNASDFFVFASVATVIAVGFIGLAEDPLRIFVAGMFAAVAVAFFGSSFVCWIQHRRFRRLAEDRRNKSMRAFAVVRGGKRSGA